MYPTKMTKETQKEDVRYGKQDDKGLPWRMMERSQDGSSAADVEGAEPSCSGVTPETAGHHKDPHFHRAIFLNQGQNAQDRLAQILTRTWLVLTMCPQGSLP